MSEQNDREEFEAWVEAHRMTQENFGQMLEDLGLAKPTHPAAAWQHAKLLDDLRFLEQEVTTLVALGDQHQHIAFVRNDGLVIDVEPLLQ